MTLRSLSPAELARAYETDLKEAFPPAELKPLHAMEAMREGGFYDPLAMFDDEGEIEGYVFLWKHPDGRYILIDYLCVPAGKRGGGIGGRLLRSVIAHYPPETVFIGESEAPVGDPERDALIMRRLGFYARNGAETVGYDCALFGVHYKTICWADPMRADEEILRRHQEIYAAQFSPEKYEKYVQIPFFPGESRKEISDWTQ